MTALPHNIEYENKVEMLDLQPKTLDEEGTETGAPPTFRIVQPEPEDPTTEQCMRAVEASGVLDFWDDPIEDVYSVSDGDSV
jgi:hypothetical protein